MWIYQPDIFLKNRYFAPVYHGKDDPLFSFVIHSFSVKKCSAPVQIMDNFFSNLIKFIRNNGSTTILVDKLLLQHQGQIFGRSQETEAGSFSLIQQLMNLSYTPVTAY